MLSAHTSIGTLGLGLLLLQAVPVAAQGAAAGGDDAETSPHGYQGVIPGTEQPPAVAPKQGAGGTTITWPGFQMRPDGGSRFFVQATGALSDQAHVTPGRITVTLGAAKLATAVNGLLLETRYFNTPVKRAFVTLNQGVAYLVLEMRVAATPQVTTEKAKTGFSFVYVDFPPGRYLGAAPAEASAPAAAPTAPATGGQAGVVRMPVVNQKRAPASLDGDVGASGSSSVSGEASAGGGKAKAKGKVKFGL